MFDKVKETVTLSIIQRNSLQHMESSRLRQEVYEDMEIEQTLPYSEIPNFPCQRSKDKGALVLERLAQRRSSRCRAVFMITKDR